MEKYIMKNIDGDWFLYETATESIVDRSNDRTKIKEKKKFFSSGGAFNGFTPSFILIDTKKYLKPENIDKELESILHMQ